MDWYNGFSPKQRARRITKKARMTAPAHITEPPCSMCGDPTPKRMWSHAEDYSEPFNWNPPASFPVCGSCHTRLHGRFSRDEGWAAYLKCLRQGWYGREVHSSMLRRIRQNVRRFVWPRLGHKPPERLGEFAYWWEQLTLDPNSKEFGIGHRPAQPALGAAQAQSGSAAQAQGVRPPAI
jgi:hypothetical protein